MNRIEPTEAIMSMSGLPSPAISSVSVNGKTQKNHRSNSLSLEPHLSLIQVCKYTTEFMQIQAKLTKLGLISHALPLTRLLCYSSISPHSNINYARSIFNLDRNPNTFSYNVMIRGYSQSDEPENGISLFRCMLCQANCLPNEKTFPLVLKACSRVKGIEEGKQVHGLVFKHGLSGDLFVQNSLIGLYSSCGFIDLSGQVFDKIENPDVVSWNCVVKGLVDSGLVEEGRKVFDKMRQRSLVSWNCLLDGYVKGGLLDKGREFFDQMEQKDTVSWNILIGGYIDSNRVEDARELFERMPIDSKDLISFNLMIDGYARGGNYDEVIQVFNEMQEAEVEPNNFTLVSVLTAYAHLAALELGERVKAYIDKRRIRIDAVVGIALIDMFAKCGDCERALAVFQNLQDKNVVAWNSIIRNLGVHGNAKEALALFSEMLTSDVSPDDATFLSVLSACCHSGLVNEGKRYFQAMKDHLAPKVEHYGCMVDLLCRANHLEEAKELIETSEVGDSVPMWGALLGASCRLGDIEMGECAAKHLFELDPYDRKGHVVLANMYAAAGLYEEANETRAGMKNLGLDKVSGTSSIEINGSAQVFRVGYDTRVG